MDNARQAKDFDLSGANLDSSELRNNGLQGFDRRLAVAMRDVPVPAQLAERLLARLQSARIDSQITTDAVAQMAVATDAVAPSALRVAEVPASPAISGPVSRRRLALRRRSVVGLAVAASLLALTSAWMLHSFDSQPLDPPHLADTWFAAVQNQTGGWRKDMAKAPAGLPIPTGIVVSAGRWMLVDKIVKSTGVAYQLNVARGAAVLFVVKMPNASGLTSRAPVNPQSTTGGRAVGVWQSPKLRYALVVEGDERAYRQLISSTQSQIAGL